jgi:hypothetical protein
MQLREAGIVDSHSWVVNPKSGEQVGSWELMERMEKTYGQPAVAILWENLLNILSDALPDDCKHMGYKCLDVSQVKRSFLSFVFPFSFPGHIRCPTFVFCPFYNSHLLFFLFLFQDTSDAQHLYSVHLQFPSFVSCLAHTPAVRKCIFPFVSPKDV